MQSAEQTFSLGDREASKEGHLKEELKNTLGVN